MHLFYCQIIIGCTSLSLLVYGCFLKWGYPQINPNHPFYVRIFHEINHPAIGVPSFLEIPNIPKKDFLKKCGFRGGLPTPPESPMKNSPPSLPERSVCRLPGFKRRRAWRIHGKIMGGMVFQQKVPLELMLLNVTYI